MFLSDIADSCFLWCSHRFIYLFIYLNQLFCMTLSGTQILAWCQRWHISLFWICFVNTFITCDLGNSYMVFLTAFFFFLIIFIALFKCQLKTSWKNQHSCLLLHGSKHDLRIKSNFPCPGNCNVPLKQGGRLRALPLIRAPRDGWAQSLWLVAEQSLAALALMPWTIVCEADKQLT